MKKLLTLLLVATLCLSLFVACKEPVEDVKEYDVAGAAAYVEALYKEDLTVTAVDFSVVSQVIVGGITYEVSWAVDTDKVTVGTPADGTVTIGVDEKSAEELSYKLTATVKAEDGTSQDVTFKLTVPKYDVNSHADYMAAKQDDVLTIEGVVVAINSKDAGNKYNHLFLADTSVTGGYYCYSVTQDPVKDLGIQVGMTVKVTGPMAPYSGMQEIKGGQVAVMDTTIKTVEPVDITAAFAAGENLGVYVGLPVVIKGVSIGSQDLEKDTSQYLYFAIGEKQGYVRTYVTDFPTTLKADNKAAIDADHAAHFGYKADATGILILYNGAPYLIPMSTTPFTNYEEVKLTSADKVKAEMDELKLNASFSSDAVVDLAAKGKYYDDVAITWATEDTTGAAVIADGKLTLTVPDKEVTVKVTATVTCADVTETKTFEIKLSKTITAIKDLLTLGAAQESYTAEKYIAGGIITEIQNDMYGNLVIMDENGDSILVYGTFIDGKKYGDFEGTKPVVGDYIVVVGVVGQYKGTAQMKNADITTVLTLSTIKDTLAIATAAESNVYSTINYMITGEIAEVQNDKYGNMVIKDAEGNSILLYGLYDQIGTRYDGMAKKPAVGDTITVYGPAGNYNGTAQLKNAVLVGFTTAAASGEPAKVEFGEGWTVTGSGDSGMTAYGSYPLELMFDGVTDNKSRFASAGLTKAADAKADAYWFVIDFAKEVTFDYILDVDYLQHWSKWLFFTSADNATWTAIDESKVSLVATPVEGVANTTNVEFTFAEDVTTRYLKIQVINTDEGYNANSTVSVWELSFYNK